MVSGRLLEPARFQANATQIPKDQNFAANSLKILAKTASRLLVLSFYMRGRDGPAGTGLRADKGDKKMGFLIRCIFWLSLVLLVIPIQTGEEGAEKTSVGAIQAFFAVRGAVQDIAGICERKPDVCETGRAALHTITARAKESARMAYDMIEGEEKQAGMQAESLEMPRIEAGVEALPTPRPDVSITTGTVSGRE